MRLRCIDAGNAVGTGTGLLTEGRIYNVNKSFGGYYEVTCDDGVVYSKLKERFVVEKVDEKTF